MDMLDVWRGPRGPGRERAVAQRASRQHAAGKRATQTGGPAKLVAIAQKRSNGMHCDKYQMKEHSTYRFKTYNSQ